jgi:hypothetical protein
VRNLLWLAAGELLAKSRLLSFAVGMTRLGFKIYAKRERNISKSLYCRGAQVRHSAALTGEVSGGPS